MRKPARRTFDDLADEFEAVGLTTRPRKKSTVIDYRATLRNHLRPVFGYLDLERLSRSPESFERYAADKINGGLSPKTVKETTSCSPDSSSKPRDGGGGCRRTRSTSARPRRYPTRRRRRSTPR